MNYATCSLCKEQGHSAWKCPDLCNPLKPGFHSGGNGGGGHGGDDDDESLTVETHRLSATTVPTALTLRRAPLSLYPGLPAACELLKGPTTGPEYGFSTDCRRRLLG